MSILRTATSTGGGKEARHRTRFRRVPRSGFACTGENEVGACTDAGQGPSALDPQAPLFFDPGDMAVDGPLDGGCEVVALDLVADGVERQ
jgi:hypothetical protein